MKDKVIIHEFSEVDTLDHLMDALSDSEIEICVIMMNMGLSVEQVNLISQLHTNLTRAIAARYHELVDAGADGRIVSVGTKEIRL